MHSCPFSQYVTVISQANVFSMKQSETIYDPQLFSFSHSNSLNFQMKRQPVKIEVISTIVAEPQRLKLYPERELCLSTSPPHL